MYRNHEGASKKKTQSNLTDLYLYWIIDLKGGSGYTTLQRKLDLTFIEAMYIQTCWVKRVKYHTDVRTSGTSGVNLEKKRRVFCSTEKS